MRGLTVRVFIFSMMSSVDADMATTPLRTALGRTKDAFMALEGAPKATCVIGKFVVSDVVFETMMGADVRRTGARRGSIDANTPRNDANIVQKATTDRSRALERVRTGRIAPPAAHPRRPRSPPKGKSRKKPVRCPALGDWHGARGREAHLVGSLDGRLRGDAKGHHGGGHGGHFSVCVLCIRRNEWGVGRSGSLFKRVT